MPMTPEEIDALPDYTPAQELKHLKHVRRTIWNGGQAYSIDGRQLTRANLKDIQAAIDVLEEDIAADTSSTEGGVVLVRYGERHRTLPDSDGLQ